MNKRQLIYLYLEILTIVLSLILMYLRRRPAKRRFALQGKPVLTVSEKTRNRNRRHPDFRPPWETDDGD